MYMLFTRFEDYQYWHLHSTWDSKIDAEGMISQLMNTPSPVMISQFKIIPVGNP